MKKLLLTLLFLIIPTVVYAQVFSQYQLINTPFLGTVMSTSASNGGKLIASSSPYFSTFTGGTATVNTLCLTADSCRTTWPSGGTGSPGGSNGQVQYNASGAFGGVATTTVTAGTNISFTPFTVIGSSPITINASGSGGNSFSWPFTVSPGGVSTSTTVGFLNGLFSTASSTFGSSVYFPSLSPSQGFAYIGSAGQLNAVATSSLNLPNSALTNSSVTINTDTNVSGGGAVSLGGTITLHGLAFPFTTNTNYNSTSTAIGFLNGLFSTASTTFSGALHLPLITTSFLGTDSTGNVYGFATSSIKTSQLNNDAGFTTNTGTVTNIATTWPIIGGPITTTGTLSFGGLGTTSTAGIGNDLILYTSHTGVITGTASSSLSLPNTALQNSAISGHALGTNLDNLSHDSSFTGTTYNGNGAVSDWGLALNHTNTWSVLQNFNYSSSTIYSSFLTASSTFLNAGSLTIATTSPGCAAFMNTGLLTSTGIACGSGGGGSSSVGPINTLQASNGSGGFIATGTPQLTVGNIIATTTASSYFLGPLAVGTTTSTSLMSRYTNNLALNAVGTDILDIGSTGLSGIVQTDRIVLKQTSANTFTNALGPGLAFSIATTSTPNGSIDLGYIGITRSVGDYNGSISIGAATNNTFTSTPSLTLDGGNARTSLLNSMFGVGTSTSQFALEVSSSTASQLVLGDGVNSQWAFRNAGGNLYIGTTSPTTFGTTTQQALSILSTGFVGINTATPTTALTFGAGTTAPFGINFGDAASNLYRSAGSQIRTDGGLVVVGAASVASISSGSSSGSIFIGTGTSDFTSVATNIANSSTAMYLFAASTGVGYRNLFGGSTMTVAPTVNANYGGNIFGAAGVTLAASGNHAILANVVVTNIGQIAQSGATVGRIAALYLEGSSTPMTNSYNLYASSTQQSYFGGNLGIGTTTPYSTLGIQNVAGTDSFSIGSSTGYDLRLDKLGRFYLGKYADCTGTNNALGITSGQILCDSLVSDNRLKTNITPLVHGLDTIMELQPMTYFWKDTTDHNTQSPLEQYGFIAQQVLPILPSAVSTTTPDAQEAVLTNGQPVYTLDKTALIAPLVQAVQELATKGVVAKRSAEENWQWIVIGLLVMWNIGLTVRRKK